MTRTALVVGEVVVCDTVVVVCGVVTVGDVVVVSKQE